MEDQDRETRIDEDVEAHGHKSHTKTREDENDVEGHAHHAAKANVKLANDEGDDDVEGHAHIAHHKAHHKA
jgi:hypothetical protein